MLLVIDVGNTHITLGVFDKKELVGTFRLTTRQNYRVFFLGENVGE